MLRKMSRVFVAATAVFVAYSTSPFVPEADARYQSWKGCRGGGGSWVECAWEAVKCDAERSCENMPIAGHRIVCPGSQINHLMNANTPKETIINMCVRRSFTAEAVVPALHGYVDPSVPSYSGQGLRAVPSRSLMPQPAPVFRGLRVQ